MAAKINEEEKENLTCPLCLDIFDEATILTCRHTFCRKCLKKYDLSHQDHDHMVCPLCRKTTKLMANRVDDLPANVSVNGLVDDYRGKCGGANYVLEMRPNCTSCDFEGDAVSFCKTCNNFMCDECLRSHQRLTSFFKGHDIIPILDIMEGNVAIGRSCEKCLKHTHEDKDLFCEDCNIHVCHKCVIVGHRDHKIKNQDDFEKELQLQVKDLIQCCTDKKSELEKNIQNLEAQRQEVHNAVQKLRTDVQEAYSTKAKRLEESRRILIEQIDGLQTNFDDDLDTLKSRDRHKIKSMCSSMTLVANDRLGCLEMDSLSAHTLLCEELDGMLKEATDHTSAAAVTEKAHKKRFKPAEEHRLDLGNISEADPEPALGCKLKEATDHTSAAAATKNAQEKRFQHADEDRLDLGNISGPDPELQVMQCVDLRGELFGLTKYSADSVAVGYFQILTGIDIIDVSGNTRQYANIPSDIRYYDLAFHNNRTLSLMTNGSEVHIYSPTGSKISTIHMTGDFYRTLNVSPRDEIIIANGEHEICIYDQTGVVKHTVPIRHSITHQASATKTDLMITSSCNSRHPSVVTVYDRDGNAGKPLQAPSDDVCLYATVDEQDRVYVASVDCMAGKVAIRLYDLDGLNLKERVQFNALNLTVVSHWCYLVSLSSDMLAFASHKKLYFIKVSM